MAKQIVSVEYFLDPITTSVRLDSFYVYHEKLLPSTRIMGQWQLSLLGTRLGNRRFLGPVQCRQNIEGVLIVGGGA